MKHVLLATTALAMTASLAAAEVTLSGRAGAGIQSLDDTSQVWSGVDIAIGASITTDSGMTLSVSDDIGGGKIADYADKELDDQSGDIGNPAVSISMGGTSATFDTDGVDDLYDDDQTGDIGISSTMGALSFGIVYDVNASAGKPEMSYSASGAMGAISLSLAGTDANDDGVEAYKVSASYGLMEGATLSVSADMVDDEDAVTEVGISYVMGDVSVSYEADSEDDWDASVAYAAGNMTVSYATDEEDEYEIDASVALGGGVSISAATDHTETMIMGVGFTF